MIQKRALFLENLLELIISAEVSYYPRTAVLEEWTLNFGLHM